MSTAPKPNIDSVTTIRDDGSRFFLHPADVKGFFTRHRRWTGLVLIAIYLSLPWINIGGHPAVFLDIAGRRFHLFGLVLAFQDAWLLFFAITGLGFSLFFITALFGRLWCGWACPQTVFLEHVYRRIERWIEGDAVQRRKLDAAPWDSAKATKRIGKQVAFIVVSLIISHLFLAYYVSIPELWSMMHQSPWEHWSAFLFVFIFSGIIYFNFAWFREQLCIVICPYGRLQSALTDDNTMVIGYDAKRGEPRGKPAQSGVGDCIDCNRCVQVCPTGIDIRQGLQLECIGCAACIDACDSVMTKLKRPTGLVRYDSLEGLEGRKTKWLRPRTILYSLLLLAGASVATYAISTVRPASFLVTRMTGAPYIVSDEAVRNQFLVRVVNKQDVSQTFRIALPDLPETVDRSGFTGSLELGPLGEQVVPLVLQVPRDEYNGRFHIQVILYGNGDAYELERQIEFVGPDPRLLKDDAQ
ncbi:cytochrome c oxidase accessory protein CcoG [Actomonas aquatica]|uniref:Cytochrome c oxidase accessory protein CcoG n=1 Tax=Actomonas aquatica TaxID=2866162 RepID=A0ABZ1C7Q6_9BACT|nr:cytochrome c oxidase accessory protein CcoG [Opitutus sp. WL0086]WRQ87367.1 cytochrome c oxidase accessory protein CcoG [Opitutus sp. WL0086]